MVDQGKVDYDSLKRLVDFHLENGTEGLVIMGTTGEAATVSFAEQLQVITAVCEQVQGRLGVVVSFMRMAW